MIARVAEGLEFPEGPRWHAGRLMFSDMLTGRVHAVGPDGALETVCEVAARPSGLGFPADGSASVAAEALHFRTGSSSPTAARRCSLPSRWGCGSRRSTWALTAR